MAAGFWRTIRWLVPLAALFYLWRAGLFSVERLRPAQAIFWALPAALALIILNTACFGLRFHCLLRCLGLDSDFRAQWKLHFAGLLAQQVGSEAAFEAMRFAGVKAQGLPGADILAAALVDRLLGLLALIALALTALAFYRPESRPYALAFVPGAALLILIALALCRRLAALPVGNGCLTSLAARLAALLLVFKGRRQRLALLLLPAAAGHVLAFLALYFCAVCLEGPSLNPLEAVAGGAVFTASQALPLPLAGLGAGETAFGAALARLRGTGSLLDFAPILLLNRLLMLAAGIIGWLWLAASSGKNR
ncbi:MAG: lysylphosphatidylglycerol synthase domain-containing protein [Deltaproteobacteria bacterium]|nr:lysylphosphatidylglycerol synthase domain-containing protein [Deltaproteobacteria bacterium]